MSADVVELTGRTEQVVAYSAREVDALFGVGAEALAIYFWLRWWMDYGTGLVGVKRSISREMIRTHLEEEIERGKGRQLKKPLSLDQVDRRLKRLVARGLLVRRGSELVVYHMPLASTRNVRQFHSRDNAATSEAPLTANAGAGLRAIAASPESANPRHIRVQGLLSTLQTSSTESEFSKPAVDKSDDDDVVDEVKPMPKPKPRPANVLDAMLAALSEASIETNGNTAPVTRWIESGRGLDQLKQAIVKAKAQRAKAGSVVPIPIGYISTIVMGMHPASTKAKAKASAGMSHWRSSSTAIRAKAREMGISEILDQKTGKPETLVQMANRMAVLLGEGGDHG